MSILFFKFFNLRNFYEYKYIKMKIAHIILTSQNGGAEKVFIDYIELLKNIGHENFAIIKHDAPYFSKLEKLQIKTQKITNKLGYYDFMAIKKIRDFVEENKIDIVIAHAGKSMVLAHKSLKKIINKKVILVAVNHSNNIKRSLCADIIFSVNKEIFFKTIDKKRTPENSFVIYNAIDLKGFEPDFCEYNFSKKSPIIIGVIGRLHNAKGFDLAIEALKILQKKSTQKFILKIAGTGEEMANLQKKVKDLNLENDVEFLGWVTNSKDFFAQIDIFILPSHVETFGLVILEAMKYGKPIIATNCDGPREILRHEIEGLIIDLKSNEGIPNQIAKNVEKLIFDQELANKLVKNSYQRLKARFSSEVLQGLLGDIFKIKN
jgi:glycosyltransferase involved in cell wall biosynthesis